jgi:methylated-DNA-[protein]-cysteine S-methyltransferase
MTTLTQTTIESPVGVLRIIASDAGIRAVLWPIERDSRVTFDEEITDGTHPILEEAKAQLKAYIDGDRDDFDLPLDLVGTDFQRAVWEGLQQIPYGSTRSYGELASDLDRPGAARAVGTATGRNPVSIIVPCHRLVGSTGSLTGFAGGIDAKRWLLDHESHKLF